MEKRTNIELPVNRHEAPFRSLRRLIMSEHFNFNFGLLMTHMDDSFPGWNDLKTYNFENFKNQKLQR